MGLGAVRDSVVHVRAMSAYMPGRIDSLRDVTSAELVRGSLSNESLMLRVHARAAPAGASPARVK